MFNNAGIVKVMPFMDVTEDDFRSMMEVNALGVLLGMQEAFVRCASRTQAARL